MNLMYILMITASYFLIKGADRFFSALSAEWRGIQWYDVWAVAMFQPFQIFLSVCMALSGVWLLRTVFRSLLRQWGTRGFRYAPKTSGFLPILLLHVWVTAICLLSYRSLVGVLFAAVFGIEWVRFFWERRRQKKLHRTLKKGTQPS